MESESHITISGRVGGVYRLLDLENAPFPRAHPPLGSATRVTIRERMRPPWPTKAPVPVLARQGQRSWQARPGFITDQVEAGGPPEAPRIGPLNGWSPR